jgi:hypothetical protein
VARSVRPSNRERPEAHWAADRPEAARGERPSRGSGARAGRRPITAWAARRQAARGRRRRGLGRPCGPSGGERPREAPGRTGVRAGQAGRGPGLQPVMGQKPLDPSRMAPVPGPVFDRVGRRLGRSGRLPHSPFFLLFFSFLLFPFL